MIDMQILNDALVTLAFSVGLAVLLAVSIVAGAALTQRYERKAGVRRIEQHLADAARRQHEAPAR
ncbi:MAG TPA: hypothetical protein VMI33_23015 [Streptosporangiaceae bacterium]|nr:hypothetical protein [Streptosporangiaceae bacterium]